MRNFCFSQNRVPANEFLDKNTFCLFYQKNLDCVQHLNTTALHRIIVTVSNIMLFQSFSGNFWKCLRRLGHIFVILDVFVQSLLTNIESL